ncbi:MAG: hypothetical protein ACRD6W_08545, partial [Nitrososphaerales archaeon]
VPVWSTSGHSLLYESNDGLFLLRSLTGRSVEIVYPLFTSVGWGESPYYGEIDWSRQFAWSGAAFAPDDRDQLGVSEFS